MAVKKKQMDMSEANLRVGVQAAILRLESLLDWSDRIGSDEIYEVEQIIKLLKK